MSFSAMSIVGLLLIIYGVVYYIRRRVILIKGFEMVGKVIDFKQDVVFYAGTQSTKEYPVVEYFDKKGDLKCGKIAFSNFIGRYKLGDKITLTKYKESLYPQSSGIVRSVIVAILGLISIIIDALIV